MFGCGSRIFHGEVILSIHDINLLIKSIELIGRQICKTVDIMQTTLIIHAIHEIVDYFLMLVII